MAESASNDDFFEAVGGLERPEGEILADQLVDAYGQLDSLVHKVNTTKPHDDTELIIVSFMEREGLQHYDIDRNGLKAIKITQRGRNNRVLSAEDYRRRSSPGDLQKMAMMSSILEHAITVINAGNAQVEIR